MTRNGQASGSSEIIDLRVSFWKALEAIVSGRQRGEKEGFWMNSSHASNRAPMVESGNHWGRENWGARAIML